MTRLALAVLLVWSASADAAVLCAKHRANGSFNATVKIREACRPSETLLGPESVGFCCGATTTSTSTSVTTTLVCPTTTTLGAPDCGGNPPAFCGGLCPGGQDCVDGGSGSCVCSGPFHCGVQNFCGGDCAPGLSCQPLPVPAGCPSIGCGCQ
jgi:hypothetical protein